MLILALGGQCNRCGYKTTIRSLDFHHIDPATKLYNLSDLLKSPKSRTTIIEEAKKCIVLCRNCHGEIHDNIWNIQQIKPVKFKECELPWYILKQNRICPHCLNSFVPKYKRHTFCSLKCKGGYKIAKSGAARPTKEELEKLLWQFPKVTIADMYKVSDRAVKKWADKYNIECPPNGYWIKTELKHTAHELSGDLLRLISEVAQFESEMGYFHNKGI